MTDWTGAKWIFPSGELAGQQVEIVGLRERKGDFGNVWVGKLTNGKEVTFCTETLDRELNPKTRKPYARGACA